MEDNNNTACSTLPMTVTGNQVAQLVTFKVGNDLYGINVSLVHEVIQFEPLTAALGALEMVEGVIDLRGDIIPVIDLRKRIKKQNSLEFKGTKIIITEVSNYIFGLIVDKVEEVKNFPLEDFMPPPGVLNKNSQFTLGMVRKADQLLLYLDLEKLLDIEQLLIQEVS